MRSCLPRRTFGLGDSGSFSRTRMPRPSQGQSSQKLRLYPPLARSYSGFLIIHHCASHTYKCSGRREPNRIRKCTNSPGIVVVRRTESDVEEVEWGSPSEGRSRSTMSSSMTWSGRQCQMGSSASGWLECNTHAPTHYRAVTQHIGMEWHSTATFLTTARHLVMGARVARSVVP